MGDFDAPVIVKTYELNSHLGKVSLHQNTMRATYDANAVPWAIPKDVVGVFHTVRTGVKIEGLLGFVSNQSAKTLMVISLTLW